MKKNKIKIIFFVLFLAILVGGYYLISYLNENKKDNKIYENYTPEQEISEEQYRETIVNLYFLNKESKQLMAEARPIDARELSQNPYKKILELLVQGTQNENLERIIPEGVVVYDASIESGCVIINVSKEILNCVKESEVKEKVINSISATLTELTEVEKISFLIEGEENKELEGEYSIKL